MKDGPLAKRDPAEAGTRRREAGITKGGSAAKR
jgi:hypothetical protein